jgi:hypothetical protein
MRYAPAYPKRALLRALGSDNGDWHTRLLAAFGPPNPPAAVLLLALKVKLLSQMKFHLNFINNCVIMMINL